MNNSIRFVHVRECDEKANILPSGGASIAYQERDDGIAIQVARNQYPDVFCYRIGREIAAGRLRKSGPYDVIPIAHPISAQVVNWFAMNFFSSPVIVHKTKNGKWISTFEPEVPAT